MRGRHHAGERHQQCHYGIDEAPGASPSDVSHRAAIIRDGMHRDMIQVNRCLRCGLPTTGGATAPPAAAYDSGSIRTTVSAPSTFSAVKRTLSPAFT